MTIWAFEREALPAEQIIGYISAKFPRLGSIDEILRRILEEMRVASRALPKAKKGRTRSPRIGSAKMFAV
jgi:hypothetical protein